MKQSIVLKFCKNSSDFEIAKSIAHDYLQWLNLDLSFQNIENEFKDFNHIYGSPQGVFIIAEVAGEIVGGVGARRLNDEICEMKRLFVYEPYRGLGIAKKICEELFVLTRSLSFKKMRLDTIPRLNSANLLYEKLGFIDILPYCDNPLLGARYMEIDIL
ncbi:MAG: GNAT family N-acetyltransferase [Flavobacteriales bacterium]|nr:GNAT family N-acetyltransferase [Flavobacteriales bacterium]|tara:strand:+ start:7637 stop:8113 length:477 start_codon:yes stop_codon:yes gene_type:complete